MRRSLRESSQESMLHEKAGLSFVEEARKKDRNNRILLDTKRTCLADLVAYNYHE